MIAFKKWILAFSATLIVEALTLVTVTNNHCNSMHHHSRFVSSSSLSLQSKPESTHRPVSCSSLYMTHCPLSSFSSSSSLPSRDDTQRMSSSSSSSSFPTRRLFFSSSLMGGTAAIVTTFLPQRALAEVARGDSLPQGAEQFQRLLVLKSDLPAVIQRLTKAKAGITTGSSSSSSGSDNDDVVKIDDREWDALSDFMRKVYKGGDDMKSYTKGGGSILSSDKEKKQKAEEDAKLLQKIAQAGDGPISKRDIEGLLLLLKKGDAVLQDFFELLRDVPDEI